MVMGTLGAVSMLQLQRTQARPSSVGIAFTQFEDLIGFYPLQHLSVLRTGPEDLDLTNRSDVARAASD